MGEYDIGVCNTHTYNIYIYIVQVAEENENNGAIASERIE